MTSKLFKKIDFSLWNDLSASDSETDEPVLPPKQEKEKQERDTGDFIVLLGTTKKIVKRREKMVDHDGLELVEKALKLAPFEYVFETPSKMGAFEFIEKNYIKDTDEYFLWCIHSKEFGDDGFYFLTHKGISYTLDAKKAYFRAARWFKALLPAVGTKTIYEIYYSIKSKSESEEIKIILEYLHRDVRHKKEKKNL